MRHSVPFLILILTFVTGVWSGYATDHPAVVRSIVVQRTERPQMDFLFRIKDKPQVIDGDTVRVLLDLGFGIFKQCDVRIAAIDTPETGLKRERPAGQAAKAVAQKWVDANWADDRRGDWYVESIAKDKYEGRIVGDLQHDTEFLSSVLLRAGAARDYDGGTKPPWTDQQLREVQTKAAEYLAK